MPPRPKTAARRPSAPLLEVEVLRLDPEGIGIGRHDGREILVAGAFPGEKVAAEIEHAGQRRITARLRRVLTPCPDRIPSPCPHAGACQGCLYIGLDYPAQLRFKEEKVRSSLAAIPALAKVPVHDIWAAPRPLGYRTDAKLVFGRQRGKVLIGLHRRGTHEVVDIGGCSLHHPLINRIVQVVREEIEHQNIYVFDPLRRTGLLRYLLVRVSPEFDKALVTFVTAERNYRELTHLAKWLQKKVPAVIGVHQNVNASDGNILFGRETVRILGAPDLLDQVGDIRLRISPTSFFQVNQEQAARLYALVRQWAGLRRPDNALDLYSGIGGIALTLAMNAGRVIGIEASEEAVRNARENARLNGQRNCFFHAGDPGELVAELALQGLTPGSVAVVNPPRSGCPAPVLQILAAQAPRQLIYVSRDPVTLARDLEVLQEAGLRPEEVQPLDMFPQTPHVETVTRLVPAPERRPRRR